jgi:ribosomal protein S19
MISHFINYLKRGQIDKRSFLVCVIDKYQVNVTELNNIKSLCPNIKCYDKNTYNGKQFIDLLISDQLENYNLSRVRYMCSQSLSSLPSYFEKVDENIYCTTLELIDVMIPLGPNDNSVIDRVILGVRKNVENLRNIFVVPYKDMTFEEDVIVFSEKDFPFSMEDVVKIIQYRSRSGWYLQQLIKLYSVLVLPCLDYVLVVDADTVLLQRHSFVENGVLLFNHGIEYHKPYFEHMIKLHPTLKKRINVSGICHHMIFERKSVLRLMNLVETYHGRTFWKVFLEMVSFKMKEFSGASEYEIYFNYMLLYHPTQIKIRPLKWKNIYSHKELDNILYDYVSYHWYSRS